MVEDELIRRGDTHEWRNDDNDYEDNADRSRSRQIASADESYDVVKTLLYVALALIIAVVFIGAAALLREHKRKKKGKKDSGKLSAAEAAGQAALNRHGHDAPPDSALSTIGSVSPVTAPVRGGSTATMGESYVTPLGSGVPRTAADLPPRRLNFEVSFLKMKDLITVKSGPFSPIFKAKCDHIFL